MLASEVCLGNTPIHPNKKMVTPEGGTPSFWCQHLVIFPWKVLYAQTSQPAGQNLGSLTLTIHHYSRTTHRYRNSH